KSISDDASLMIVKLVDNHPYYAQQLAQLSWLRTKDVCTVDIVREAHTALVEQLSLLFVTITETLTTQQLNFLKAFIAGEKALSSTEVMHRYRISSATSAARSKAALIKNDILDSKAGEISFQDPIYAYWLKTEYFAE
ncbi:MAG: ATPase, partial [Bacteroidetes bacterium]|nr:ATPase [Candidatus Cryptobacteroides excrementipullorum]